MAYFRVTSVIKQYPELVVTNIYEIDEYELQVLLQGASGYILENIMVVSEEFKESSSGKVSFGIRKPEPVTKDLFSSLVNSPDDVKTELRSDPDFKSESDSDLSSSSDTQVVAEIVNPFYYAQEKEPELSVSERFSLRQKELTDMLARDIRDLAESMNITYKNKADAIEKILKLEFPD